MDREKTQYFDNTRFKHRYAKSNHNKNNTRLYEGKTANRSGNLIGEFDH